MRSFTTADNSGGKPTVTIRLPSRTGQHILYLKPNYLSGGWSECGKRITGSNFLTVFHSKYGSTLLSFRHTTMESTTDDGWMTTTIAYLVLKVGRQQTGLNRNQSYLAEVTVCAVFRSCARFAISALTRRLLAIRYLLLQHT